MKLSISNNLLEKHPNTALAQIICDIKYMDKVPELIEVMNQKVADIEENIKMEDIAKFPIISDSRKAYKAFGKDPSRYRLSAEALHRRILKKQGIYFINNIVDITNLISMETKFSLGTYDMEKLKGDVTFEIAEPGANYEGINRGNLNIEYLPAFKDETSYFGNPTGDSERTMVRNTTTKMLMVIISFSGKEVLNNSLNFAFQLLNKYAHATNIETEII